MTSQPITFHQFHDLDTELDLHRLWVVSMEHLQRVWHASRERLPFRTPGSVPILGLANAPIVETKFLELAMSLLDFSTRIPLGTFSILLNKIKKITQTNIIKAWNILLYLYGDTPPPFHVCLFLLAFKKCSSKYSRFEAYAMHKINNLPTKFASPPSRNQIFVP